MALPVTVNHPTKTITLPLSKLEVKFRPFLVKEEKILIMLRENDDAKAEDYVNTIAEMVNSCCFNAIDSMKLPSADLEYLFLKIRSMSKGNISKLVYRCKAEKDDKECGALCEVDVDIDGIEPTMHEGHTTAIEQPGTDIVVHFNYPTLETLKKVSRKADQGKVSKMDMASITFVDCFKMVTQGDLVSTADTEQEISTFMEELSDSFFDLMDDKFMGRMPTLEKDVHFKCEKCGHEEEVHLKGLKDFF